MLYEYAYTFHMIFGTASDVAILSHNLSLSKVYTLSVAGDRLIVGTAGRRVLVWDLRNMGYVQQRRESSLKYQTRCIRAFPNKQVDFIKYKDCVKTWLIICS